MPPTDLMAAILSAPVDLFWNGGIGTFVKASYETNTDVGDRRTTRSASTAPTFASVSSARAATSASRRRGESSTRRPAGEINTDAIDNSAGVDCSDHEVNLKILLGIPVANGDLTMKQRNDLLREVEQDVASHVLYDNYLQAQILSQEVAVSVDRLEAYEDLMTQLETERAARPGDREPALDRADGRAAHGPGRPMARPELCVLLAYAKRSLEEAVRESALPDDPYLERDLRRYFPAAVVDRFGAR